MVYEFAELRGLVGCQAGGRLSTRSLLQINASREEAVPPLQPKACCEGAAHSCRRKGVGVRFGGLDL
jgi:hypothetical protein